MEQLTKQSIGIDIAKESFSACVCQRDLSGDELLSEVAEFRNNKTGFNQLVRWSKKFTRPSPEVIYVMEATGSYYENLAHHLYDLKQQVSVLLPNKVNHYAKSLNVKTKTDSVDARVIAKLGVERKLSLWQPPSPVLKYLRDLTRQCSDLKKERTVFINRLKAVKSGFNPQPFIIKSNKTIIKQLTKQIEKCEAEIKKLIQSEEWLRSKVEKILTIKGVGIITVAIILAETQGFEFVQNTKQLTSYAGLDVVRRESGTSVMGKTRISKKGNSRIRAALFLPAMISSLRNEDLRKKYHRIIEDKSSKMIGITALQRRILILIYTLWRKDEIYIENYGDQSVYEHKAQAKPKEEDSHGNKAGRSNNLPAQDELQLNQSKLSLV
jgi:transposase